LQEAGSTQLQQQAESAPFPGSKSRGGLQQMLGQQLAEGCRRAWQALRIRDTELIAIDFNVPANMPGVHRCIPVLVVIRFMSCVAVNDSTQSTMSLLVQASCKAQQRAKHQALVLSVGLMMICTHAPANDAMHCTLSLLVQASCKAQ
jgi:hypothetical protein